MTSRGYEVVTPRAVAPLIAQLQGQRAGYAATYAQLQRDPCATALGGYRLSGPLEPAVCGLHLRNGWRLAFTMQPAEHEDALPSVVVLFVGKREPRHGTSDVGRCCMTSSAWRTRPRAITSLPAASMPSRSSRRTNSTRSCGSWRCSPVAADEHVGGLGLRQPLQPVGFHPSDPGGGGTKPH